MRSYSNDRNFSIVWAVVPKHTVSAWSPIFSIGFPDFLAVDMVKILIAVGVEPWVPRI